MKIQASIIQDTIELTNVQGETIKEIPYRINIAQIADRMTKLQIDLADASKQKDMETAGRLTVDMFTLVFGDEVTKELLDFYANDYTALMFDIFPIISEQVLPSIIQLRKKGLAARKKAKVK